MMASEDSTSTPTPTDTPNNSDLKLTVTESDLTQAESSKTEANKLFQSGKYEASITKYTEAISYNPYIPAYYTNRAFAYIKTECYGYAIRDAQKAIELDPTFVKAYYRKAVANMALSKFKDALKDFKAVTKVAPGDKDARSKMVECEKEVRRRQFEEAIACDELHRSAIELLGDINEMIVEESYQGPRLEISTDGSGEMIITQDFITNLLPYLKSQKTLHKKFAYAILANVNKIFSSEPSLVDITVPKGSRMTVCGDVHGQFYDLLNIFELNGLPSPTNMYLFNGDFVDRGSFSVEVIFTLFAYKWLYPNSFFLSRGNHETIDMNRVYGFEGEVKTKYTDATFRAFTEIFNNVPLCNLIQKRVLVLHGGLFSKDDVSLDDLRNIDRRRQPGSEGLMCELLWSDPQDAPGRGASKRGVALQFGPDVTDNFCKHNGLDCIIRSHEVKQDGYVIEHGGKCITVFSAPNYCDNVGNKGAFIHITPDTSEEKGYSMEFKQFEAVPHPNIPAMKYASGMFGRGGGYF